MLIKTRFAGCGVMDFEQGEEVTHGAPLGVDDVAHVKKT